MADMMAVMNAGKIVEFGPSEAIYRDPREEYTRKLISATPNDDLDHIRQVVAERERTWAASCSLWSAEGGTPCAIGVVSRGQPYATQGRARSLTSRHCS